MARDVVVVPHTHWDREWYEPFETFRMKLVDTIDALLDLLESDPGFTTFMLDGQMATVDDYLEVRPGAAARIAALVGAGRLSIGPWYVLMDEFMVSAETIVRNMDLGRARAAELGGAMEIGYLPDMFGHVAQMPQILAQFGLTDAVVWRGVPSAITSSAFIWEAPDGSRVRAEYLIDGYGVGADAPQDPQELIGAIGRFERRNSALLDDRGSLLWMNGRDHAAASPWLSDVVAKANSTQGDYSLRISTLGDHIASCIHEGLATWHGELRSSARANLLMGVASNRVDVHNARAAAERALEKLAEPLSALLLDAGSWPGELMARAWKEMVRNAAHDSSCACSVDAVCDDVLRRYSHTTQIAEGLTARALDVLAGSLRDGGPVVVNPTSRPRSGVVEIDLPGTEPLANTQQISANTGLAPTEVLTRETVAVLADAAIDFVAQLGRVDVGIDGSGVLDVRLSIDHELAHAHDAWEAREQIRSLMEEDPHAPARLTIDMPASQHVLAWAQDVGGFGWARWETSRAALPPSGPVAVIPEAATGEPEGDVTIANGVITVVVDSGDGTISITSADGTRSASGLCSLVDGGDSGDMYNWSPPAQDRIIDTPSAVDISVSESGPLRAQVRVVRTYDLPEAAFFSQRIGEVATAITTTYELSAGSDAVVVNVELDNRCRDHRLRMCFPLPEPADASVAECAFGTVTRGLDAEGGPTEVGLATYPARRFVCTGGLTVLHDRMNEYELVDRDGPGGTGRARTLALTVLRSTGLLSNGPMQMRPMPAGPIIPVEGAQVQGRHQVRFAVKLGDDTKAAFEAADELWTPLMSLTAPGGGTEPDTGSALDIRGAQVSAVFRSPDGSGALCARVFNPHDAPTMVDMPGRSADLLDLTGAVVGDAVGFFELGPHRIAILRFT